jgi:dTDP-glucose 4,6-dehydratase
MRILVTGGYGFIGSHFIKYMFSKYNDLQITNIDALTYASNLRNLDSLKANSNYRFIKGDITDSKLVNELFEKEAFEYVVHFAAESHVDRSITQPDLFVRTNILGTQVLLDASLKHGVKKYLQISTDEVYGTLGKEGLFTEETTLNPNSPYSASKAGGDMLVRAYFETYQLPINITRCSNNYGPYQHREKLIPHMVYRAYTDQSLPVYGNGLNIRDWLHVLDHCKAIDLVLLKGRIGQVYNIGGNTEKTNIEVVKKIVNYLDKPDSLITYVNDRLGHDFRYAIDFSKIQKELGWFPEYSFEQGLEDTIDWYIQNEYEAELRSPIKTNEK